VASTWTSRCGPGRSATSLSADPFDLAASPETGLLALTDGAQRVLVDTACGGTIHRLELVPAPGGLRAPRRAEAVILGDDPVPPDPEVRRSSPGGFRGRLLVPFNDRIIDGTYRWGGEPCRLPGNDAGTGDAIHGFLYRAPCTARMEPRGIRLAAVLPPREGYPFALAVEIDLRLEPSSFAMTLSIHNAGSGAAPVAAGWHPYFRLPRGGDTADAPVDSLFLHVPAGSFAEVDDRLAPTGRLLSVAGTSRDFSRPRRIGVTDLDDAFVPDTGGGLEGSDPGGSAGTATLSGVDRALTISGGGIFRMFQIYIPPDRESIAIEPVTSPANVFNRPEMGLLVLPPGGTATGTIRVEYHQKLQQD
jgi:aldose 1-epimerase